MNDKIIIGYLSDTDMLVINTGLSYVAFTLEQHNLPISLELPDGLAEAICEALCGQMAVWIDISRMGIRSIGDMMFKLVEAYES